MGSGFSIGLLDKLVGRTHRLVVVCVTSRWVRNVFLDGGSERRLETVPFRSVSPYTVFFVWSRWTETYYSSGLGRLDQILSSKGARANATSQKKREQIHYS